MINHFIIFSSNSIMLNLREIIDSVVDVVNRKTDKNGGCGNIGPVKKILGIWRGMSKSNLILLWSNCFKARN